MALFSKGPTKKTTQVPLVTVIDRMRSAGIADKEIVSKLRAKGYDSTTILEAMKQADLKQAVNAGGFGDEGDLTQFPLDEGGSVGEPNLPAAPEIPPRAQSGLSNEDIEEVAETIISEKWKTVTKDIDELKAWKEKVEEALEAIKGKAEELGDTLDRLKSSLSEQVSRYSQNIEDVTSEVKAMDKIFRQILPTFTENVKELSNIVSGLKKGKK